jgi:D-sedoheptulose 7-phosphate isomerase
VTRPLGIAASSANGRRGSTVPAPCAAGPITRHTAAHLVQVAEGDLDACADALHAAVIRGSSIYTFGNGGSATTASHLACDLSHRRPGAGGRRARARSLCDLAITTAIGNDCGYDQIFAAPLQALLDRSDVLLAVSVSGNSANVLRALELGREHGAMNIALLGCDGGEALALSDVWLRVPCDDPGVVESVHLAVTHELAARVHGAPLLASDPAVTPNAAVADAPNSRAG